MPTRNGSLLLRPQGFDDLECFFELFDARLCGWEVIAISAVFLRCQPAPMPSRKRPPLRNYRVAPILASSAGLRNDWHKTVWPNLS